MLVLKDATYIDWKTLAISKCDLEVGPGVLRKVAAPAKGRPRGRVLDCRGLLVTKSFAIAHHHVYSALAVGMPAPRRPPRSFVEILERVWWRLDKALDREMIRASALAAGLEAAKSGVTFVVDHHSSPNAVRGSLETIAEALDELGLSHLLCYELSDRDGARRRDEGLEETSRHLEKRQGLVGLHASFTVSPLLLRRAVDIAVAFGTGVHVHAAEADSDQDDCLRRYGRRVLERFAGAGLLRLPKSILAHGLHLSAAERRLFRDGAAWLVENPESNQNNGVGRFKPEGLGPRVLIGTDGMHGDAVRSAQAAYLSARSNGGMAPEAAYARLRQVHRYLSENRFEGDGDDNLVVLEYRPPTDITPANWPGHLLYGLRPAHVHSVIARGRLIVEDRRLVRADEDAITRFAKRQAQRLWQRL